MIKWICKKLGLILVHPTGRYEFEKIDKVLIIHIPIGRMPNHQAEEYVKKTYEHMQPNIDRIKSDFGVNTILYVPKIGD